MTKPEFVAYSPSDDKPEILAEGKGQVFDADDLDYLAGIDLTMDEWESAEDDLAYHEL
jgi:hypothetical protein